MRLQTRGTQSHRMTSYSRPTDTADVECSASGGISENVNQIRPVTSQVKTEYRYDWSNVPVFLTSTQNVYSKDQSTATLGLVWWFRRKQGAW